MVVVAGPGPERCKAALRWGDHPAALHGGHPVALTALDSTAAHRTTAHQDPSISYLAPRCGAGGATPHRSVAVLCRRALPPCSGSPPETHLGAATDAHLSVRNPLPLPPPSRAGTVSFRAPSRWGGEGAGAVAPSARRPEGHTRGTQRSHRPPTCCHCVVNLRVDGQAMLPSP
ncbi:hypothetical protein ACCO45_013021 [Purpureocillium lilacinum]|uniref:Uncharacterized protein n=1 Tax=Purpureocillium lilacinum TaxID=33203 RepID=A0ACC4DCQ7_PURLI